MNTGYPKVYWLPGFFFAQSFLTGTMQNYARRYKVPIDFVKFNYELIDSDPIKVKK
jgi:dynein heavy chain